MTKLMKQYNKRNKENADQRVFWYKNASNTFPSIVSCFTREKNKAEKQANTKTNFSPPLKGVGPEKATSEGTAVELLA